MRKEVTPNVAEVKNVAKLLRINPNELLDDSFNDVGNVYAGTATDNSESLNS